MQQKSPETNVFLGSNLEKLKIEMTEHFLTYYKDSLLTLRKPLKQ